MLDLREQWGASCSFIHSTTIIYSEPLWAENTDIVPAIKNPIGHWEI